MVSCLTHTISLCYLLSPHTAVFLHRLCLDLMDVCVYACLPRPWSLSPHRCVTLHLSLSLCDLAESGSPTTLSKVLSLQRDLRDYDEERLTFTPFLWVLSSMPDKGFSPFFCLFFSCVSQAMTMQSRVCTISLSQVAKSMKPHGLDTVAGSGTRWLTLNSFVTSELLWLTLRLASSLNLSSKWSDSLCMIQAHPSQWRTLNGVRWKVVKLFLLQGAVCIMCMFVTSLIICSYYHWSIYCDMFSLD